MAELEEVDASNAENDDTIVASKPAESADKASDIDVAVQAAPFNESTDETESKSNTATVTAQNNADDDDIKVHEQADEEEKNEITDSTTTQSNYDELDKILLSEPTGTDTNNLSWDEIQFASNDEREGAMALQTELRSKHKLESLPPFEMARFYIGSKCRIPKASQKWLDTMTLYKTHHLQSITEQQMIKCFREMHRCMRFGGNDNDGKAIFAMKYSLWLPDNYDGIDVIMKCFLYILNVYTENLDVSRNGMIFIADCKDLGWVNFNVDMEKVFMSLMQDAYPLRVGAMYMLDAPWLLNVLMKICKPFLSSKMQERMHIMSSEEMFKTVPKEQVPSIITGGEYDDEALNPMYQTCIRYMRRTNIDHFAPLQNIESNTEQDAQNKDVAAQ